MTGPCEGSCSTDEEKFSFTNIEFKMMHSCPSGDVCQTFRDEHLNLGVGEGSGKREELLGFVCIELVK